MELKRDQENQTIQDFLEGFSVNFCKYEDMNLTHVLL